MFGNDSLLEDESYTGEATLPLAEAVRPVPRYPSRGQSPVSTSLLLCLLVVDYGFSQLLVLTKSQGREETLQS